MYLSMKNNFFVYQLEIHNELSIISHTKWHDDKTINENITVLFHNLWFLIKKQILLVRTKLGY